MKPIDIDTKWNGWISEPVICLQCGHNWAAVYLQSHTSRFNIQCPKCHQQGLTQLDNAKEVTKG